MVRSRATQQPTGCQPPSPIDSKRQAMQRQRRAANSGCDAQPHDARYAAAAMTALFLIFALASSPIYGMTPTANENITFSR
jgi:hypothetical protein